MRLLSCALNLTKLACRACSVAYQLPIFRRFWFEIGVRWNIRQVKTPSMSALPAKTLPHLPSPHLPGYPAYIKRLNKRKNRLMIVSFFYHKVIFPQLHVVIVFYSVNLPKVSTSCCWVILDKVSCIFIQGACRITSFWVATNSTHATFWATNPWI